MTRLAALLALAVPTLAGLANMALFAAPQSYLLINAGALTLAVAVITIEGPVFDRRAQMIAGTILLLVYALPLLTGPTISGPYTEEVRRWLAIGPLTLHAGMVTIPGLVVLAARHRTVGSLGLAIALLIALFQPDFASAFAITGGAVGIYQVRSDWRLALVIILGFFIAIAAALRAELPAVPFVERIVIDALRTSVPMALLLAISLIAATLMMLFGTGLPRRARYPLGMSLFGFLVSSLISNYPTPLAGYGAAAIIGFAIAYALAFSLPEPQESDP